MKLYRYVRTYPQRPHRVSGITLVNGGTLLETIDHHNISHPHTEHTPVFIDFHL